MKIQKLDDVLLVSMEKKTKQRQKQGVTDRALSEEEFTYRMSMFRRIVKSQCSLFSTVKQKEKKSH